jgi:hypothetical protein
VRSLSCKYILVTDAYTSFEDDDASKDEFFFASVQSFSDVTSCF